MIVLPRFKILESRESVIAAKYFSDVKSIKLIYDKDVYGMDIWIFIASIP
jgi:hypothetical protein